MVSFSVMELKKRSWRPFTIGSVIPSTEEQAGKIADEMKKLEFIPEFRFDLSAEMDEACIRKYIDVFTENGGYGIFTYRSTSKDLLGHFYQIAMEYENFVMDIDMHYAGVLGKDQRGKTIISSHFTNHTEAEGRVGKIMEMNPEALKIALPMNTVQFTRIINFIGGLGMKIPVALIPMGKESYLRVASAITVSDFAYTHYEKRVAEGQYSVQEFSNILDQIEHEA